MVKGPNVWCQACGHGGHLIHMQEWFSKYIWCPAGCGHICEYTWQEGRKHVIRMRRYARPVTWLNRFRADGLFVREMCHRECEGKDGTVENLKCLILKIYCSSNLTWCDWKAHPVSDYNKRWTYEETNNNGRLGCLGDFVFTNHLCLWG